MPYINVQVTKGVTRDQMSELVKQMTATLVEVLGKSPEHIHMVIPENGDDDWDLSGMLTSDWK